MPALDNSARPQAWHWLEARHANAHRDLNFGEQHTFTVTQGATCIVWTARPVTFLVLADRDPGSHHPVPDSSPRPTGVDAE
ncbi:hypothetical protein GCM10023347_04720 [Streptomyces chumphonensis]